MQRARETQQVEINGVAHIQISVDRYEECVAFYDQVMPYLGLKAVHRSDQFVYYVGGRTAHNVSRADPQHAGDSHVPTRSGLHHICFRARSREDVDEFYGFLQGIDATMVRAPEEGPWAPGYYSLSFLDPDGIRLEVNHVPGKGVLAEGASFDPAPGYPVTGRQGLRTTPHTIARQRIISALARRSSPIQAAALCQMRSFRRVPLATAADDLEASAATHSRLSHRPANPGAHARTTACRCSPERGVVRRVATVAPEFGGRYGGDDQIRPIRGAIAWGTHVSDLAHTRRRGASVSVGSRYWRSWR